MAPKVPIRDVDGSPTLELPSSLSTSFRPGSELFLKQLGPDALLLLKELPKGGGYFAGDLSSLTVAELFGHMVTGVRTGKLVLSSGATRKTVSFQDGQVVFATSTEPHERLGATLVKLGIVTEQQLQDALKKVSPKQKLGQVLTSSGVVTAPRLYSAMTFTAREIVIDLFQMTEGVFLFLEGLLPPDALKLPERTRELVLDGMARSEEKIRAKRLEELEAKRVARPVVQSKATAFVDFIREVSQTLLTAGVGEEADLSSYFSDAPTELEVLFKDVTLSPSGELDLARLTANAQQAGGGEPAVQARLQEALSGFAAYALFTAKNVLPEELSAPLEEKARKLPENVS